VANPRDILDEHKPAKDYKTSEELVGVEIEIPHEVEVLDNDYNDDGIRWHVQVRIVETGETVTWQPSDGMRLGDLGVLRDHGADQFPLVCKIGTYPTRNGGKGFKLLFSGDKGY
jgi:hypothetical protein